MRPSPPTQLKLTHAAAAAGNFIGCRVITEDDEKTMTTMTMMRG